MYDKDSVEIYQEVDFGKRTTAKYVLLSKANCIMETRLNPRNAFHVYLFEDPLWILTSKELASCLFCSPALTERTMLVKIKSTRVQPFFRNVLVTMASYFCDNTPNVEEPAAFTIWIRAIELPRYAVGSCEDGRFCVLVTSFSKKFMSVTTSRRLP